MTSLNSRELLWLPARSEPTYELILFAAKKHRQLLDTFTYLPGPTITSQPEVVSLTSLFTPKIYFSGWRIQLSSQGNVTATKHLQNKPAQNQGLSYFVWPFPAEMERQQNVCHHIQFTIYVCFEETSHTPLIQLLAEKALLKQWLTGRTIWTTLNLQKMGHCKYFNILSELWGSECTF